MIAAYVRDMKAANMKADATAAIASFGGVVKVCPAYTRTVYWKRNRSGERAVALVKPRVGGLPNELQAKKARALPMNSYNGIAT